ncbi:MAG: hypothetical protein IKE93_05555 [Erysipelotrichaceae bacterium]|nr:hypothetical protein [Erysipelotrichaceae bacterium]
MNLKNMLRYLDEDDIRDVAREILNGNEEYEGVSLISLLPFMDQDDVDDIALEVYRREGNYTAILPFVSEEVVGELARAAIENNEDVDVVAILPFMDEDDVDELFLELARKGKTDPAMYPFVSEDGWHEVLEGYLDNEFEFDFDEAYPFMDEDDIRDLFKHEIKKHKKFTDRD